MKISPSACLQRLCFLPTLFERVRVHRRSASPRCTFPLLPKPTGRLSAQTLKKIAFYTSVVFPVRSTHCVHPVICRALATQALGAVGSLLLVLGSEEQTEAGLLLCESIFVQAHGAKKGIVVPMKDRCPTLLVQALRAWGVLASSLRTSRLAGAVTARYLGVMGDLLDHDNSGVRLEAGQNLALLHEAVSEGEEPDFSPLAGGSLDEDAGLQQQASGGSGKRPSFRPFLERLQELAEGFDRQQAKQARREQRAGFRAILKSLEGRADAEGARQMQPTESLALGKVRIVITGWREIRRYDFVRSALAGGFLVHLRGGCGIVPDLLDLDPEELQLEVSGAGEQASWDAKAARQERFRRADKEVQQAREKDRRKKQQLQQQGLFAGSDE